MDIVDGLVEVASRWSDPDHEPRAKAAAASIGLDNRFSEESIAFAVNQQMNLIHKKALTKWAARLKASETRVVGVLNPGNIPMVELQDFIAVLCSGNSYLGSVSSKSPHLFPAFVSELKQVCPQLNATLTSQEKLLESADFLMASGTSEVMEVVAKKALEAGILPDQTWFRGHRFSIAVLGGEEDEDTLLGLAEDVLMHEGLGCRSVALVFAPEAMPIDGLLDVFAAHRSMFPAHDATKGSLKLQQAYLAAIGAPHAFGENHEFLISRGAPEEQSPCHLRWVPYTSLEEVQTYLAGHASLLQCVFSTPAVKKTLTDGNEEKNESFSWEQIGDAQRPALDWAPDGQTHISFLAR